MKFLTKHYEKIILVALLLIFVVLLVYLLQITKEANNTSENDLKIKEPRADYQSVEFNDERFELDKVFAPKLVWAAYGTREVDYSGNQVEGIHAGQITDMLVPFAAATCPNCERFVPMYYFTNGMSCPACGVILTPPNGSFADDADFGTRPSDMDGDGIPNIFEDQHSFLSSNNASDARADKDRDGFSNLYEYMCRTNLDDGKDHPPLTDLLYIANPRPPQFSGALMSVDQNAGSMQMQFATGRPRTINVGQSFYVDRRNFELVEILDDNSVIVKFDGNGKEFTVKKDSSVEIPVEIMTIMNLGTNRTVDAAVDTNIEIGSTVTGKQRWKVTELNMAEGTATITDGDGNTEVLTTVAKIPPRARLK